MATPTADIRDLNQTSGLVELYTLDCTNIGGLVYNFTSNVTAAGGSLSFGGVSYTALPVSSSGWDFSSTGSPPKPTLTVSNVNKTFLYAVITLGDLVGAYLTRVRTFEKYLDGGASPDSTKKIGPDIYVIEQKISHDNTGITWQMTSIIDRMGTMLPRRQILKDKGFPGTARTRVN